MNVGKNKGRGGFTLVEMLVVIAIVAILAAIIIPAGNMALRASRRAANGFEISQLIAGIERYKSENGGIYPPSFGEAPFGGTYATSFTAGTWRNTLLGRYVQKAYPKASNRDIAYLFTEVADQLDQSSALVFWLNQTSADARYPFTGAAKRSYFVMDERQLGPTVLVPANAAATPPIPALQLYGFRPKHAGESYYIYIESRHYPMHVNTNLSSDQTGSTPRPAAGTGAARLPENSVRPWLRQALDTTITSPTNLASYINGDSFQLHSAGLDGRYCANHDFLRKFPCGDTGLNFAGQPLPYDDFVDDRDNQTNFSEGNTIDSVPAQ